MMLPGQESSSEALPDLEVWEKTLNRFRDQCRTAPPTNSRGYC